MATKTYGYHVPHARFIDSRGKVHKFNGSGKLTTDDAALQAELDAAIKSGQAFTVGEAAPAPVEEILQKQKDPAPVATTAAANPALAALLKKGTGL